MYRVEFPGKTELHSHTGDPSRSELPASQMPVPHSRRTGQVRGRLEAVKTNDAELTLNRFPHSLTGLADCSSYRNLALRFAQKVYGIQKLWATCMDSPT